MDLKESAIRAIKCCLSSDEACDRCPYYKSWEAQAIDLDYSCCDAMKLDILKLLEEDDTPRIASLAELQNGTGHGWWETWYQAEDDMPEEVCIMECVWIHGMVALSLDEYANFKRREFTKNYRRKYGDRVWICKKEPTQEQRDAVPWMDPLEGDAV